MTPRSGTLVIRWPFRGGWILATSARERVLLVGAGHPHLHVVTCAPALRAAGTDLIVLAPVDFHYSGLASAVAAGAQPPEAARIDVAALCRRHGVEHRVGRFATIDPEQRTIGTEDGGTLGYDRVSFNLGSVVAPGGMRLDPDVPAVKPFERLSVFVDRLDELDASATPRRPVRISIVGGGPSGLELAGQLAARLRTRGLIRLLERDERPGAGLPVGARRRSVRRLMERNVEIRVRSHVEQVAADHLVVNGQRQDHDLAMVATGLSAPPTVLEAGLGDARGIPVRATLQHVDHDEVYAVGDTAYFTPGPLPRLGVYGVRQGPVLVASLLAARTGAPLPPFEPQREALRIVDLGAGRALAARGRWWTEGRGSLLLKRRIDERWLARYR